MNGFERISERRGWFIALGVALIVLGMIAIAMAVPAVLGGLALAAQDRYALKVPNGLAFSDFRGYDTWQPVAVSQTEKGMKLIAAGVPLGALMELGKEYAGAVDRTARQAVDLFDLHVRERIQSEGGATEAAERRLLETFNDLLEASGTLVRHHFERTLLRAARDHIEKR